MHFHWQNLNEKKSYRKRGQSADTGWPYHGRCWWHFSKGPNRTVGFCWNLWSYFCHLEFSIHDGWNFSIAFPPVAFWLHFQGFKLLDRFSPRRLSKYLKEPTWLLEERECRISFHDWTLYINPWSKVMETNFSDPWWVRGVTFNLPDFIFGRTHYSKEELDHFELHIPMLEANYIGNVKIERCRWKRPRWFTTVRTSAWVDIVERGGIPHPGKGENSWDCGMDGLCGYGCSSTKPEDIIAKGVECALENRRKYGGSTDWIPSAEEIAVAK